MDGGIIQTLAYFLHSKDINPLRGQLSKLTQSEIVQIRVVNKEYDWIPIQRHLSSHDQQTPGGFYEEFSRTVAEGVTQTKTHIDIGNMTQDAAGNASLEAYQIKSFACFPIQVNDTVIGVIFLASLNMRNPLAPEIVTIIQSLAHSFAYILGHERYYEEILQRHNLERGFDQYGIVTQDPGMKSILGTLPRIAQTKAPVIISGETGVGKELVAKAIHRLSRRSERPFVTVHCGAIAESLIESELFGHVKGAFTGATGDKPGFFGLAHGGTIFLDEISTASAEAQIRLLRVLENGEISPVGSARVRKIDVRVIVAGSEDIGDLVRKNLFRKDLYYRLKVLEVHIPPLRERRGDIKLLADHFAERFSQMYGKNILGFSDKAQDTLARYAWEGNVRQLRHIIEKLVIFAEPNSIIDHDAVRNAFSPDAAKRAAEVDDVDANLFESYEDFKERVLHKLERSFLKQMMDRHLWSYSPAARSLNMPRSSLINRLSALSLRREQM